MFYFRQTRALTANEFLTVVDRLHLGHFQGGGTYDIHFGTVSMNLLGLFLKAYRLKCGELRDNYSSPFQAFDNPLGREGAHRFYNLRVMMGDFGNFNNDHSHATYTNLQRLIEYFGFTEHLISFDTDYNECK